MGDACIANKACMLERSWHMPSLLEETLVDYFLTRYGPQREIRRFYLYTPC
jgi:hypothetical protein